MNNKKILLRLFSFLLLVLLTNIANAQGDFTAVSSRSVELCPCSNQAYTVTVQNTGSVQSSYAVLASGDAAEWVAFNPEKFVLNPGQKGAFSVIVNSICNIKGDFGLEIFITTNSRLTKVVKQVLSFSQCYDYSLEPGEVDEGIEESISFLQHDGPYSLCREEQKSIPILISNNENFGNRYKLLLDAPSWAELNVGSVSLGPKKSGIFLINFDTRDIEGEFNFKLNAISELGKVQRKENIEANVEECYALEVELEKDKDVICGGEGKSYDITLKNLGSLRQNVNLAVDGPDWAGFENTALQSKPVNKNNIVLNLSDNESKNFEIEPELTLDGKKVLQLNPGEEKTAGLNVNPPEDISGNFEIVVHTTPDKKTEFRSSDTINVNVMEKLACYKADISTKTSVTNFYSKDLLFVKVKNDGIKKAAYDVGLEGVSWVSVSPDSLELNPGQTGNLNLNVNPTEDIEPGTYGIEINLESNGAVYSKNVNIVLKKENEFVKGLKANVKFYRYYIYLLILLIILITIFRRRIIKIKNNAKVGYERYKVKRERLKALKLARKEREEERKKEEEKKKNELEEERKRKLKEKKNKREKKFKVSLNRVWIYVLLIIVAIIFIGHQSRLFNAKYLHLYLRNFFYGYLYYISIGIGIAVALFLLVLFYNYIHKKSRNTRKQDSSTHSEGNKKVKRETKKAEKKARIRRKQFIPYHKIIFLFLAGILIYSIGFFEFFENIKFFFVLYQYYFIIGVVILFLIVLLIRFYKPLFKFLRE